MPKVALKYFCTKYMIFLPDQWIRVASPFSAREGFPRNYFISAAFLVKFVRASGRGQI
jgi:hypothetical protein